MVLRDMQLRWSAFHIMLTCRKPSKTTVSEEEKLLRCHGLFDEYLQNVDANEAVLCAQELATPGIVPSYHLPACALRPWHGATLLTQLANV